VALGKLDKTQIHLIYTKKRLPCDLAKSGTRKPETQKSDFPEVELPALDPVMMPEPEMSVAPPFGDGSIVVASFGVDGSVTEYAAFTAVDDPDAGYWKLERAQEF
jgi:hypothetical protein